MSGGVAEPAWRVGWAATADDIPAHLWAACFPAALEGYDWYRTLEGCGIESQFQFMYGVVYRHERAVAIAPAFVMDVPMALVLPPALLPIFRLLGKFVRSALFQRTLFIGSPCADEGRLGIAGTAEPHAVFLAVQRAAQLRARELDAAMLVWKDFPAQQGALLGELAASAGLFAAASFPGTLCELPGPRREDYFAALKGSRRHQLRKKLRLSAEAVAVDIAVLQQPGEAVLDEIFALFWQTYEKAGTKFERLNRRFFTLIAATPAAHFIVLRERDSQAMIAFMLCFADGEQVINKFIGIDYRRPKEWLLYFRLWEAVLDWSLARGARSIQSGQTGYAPKIEMGHRLVPLTNYCAHRHPLVHRLYARIARSISWQTLDADLARHVAAHPQAGACAVPQASARRGPAAAAIAPATGRAARP